MRVARDEVSVDPVQPATPSSAVTTRADIPPLDIRTTLFLMPNFALLVNLVVAVEDRRARLPGRLPETLPDLLSLCGREDY